MPKAPSLPASQGLRKRHGPSAWSSSWQSAPGAPGQGTQKASSHKQWSQVSCSPDDKDAQTHKRKSHPRKEASRLRIRWQKFECHCGQQGVQTTNAREVRSPAGYQAAIAARGAQQGASGAPAITHGQLNSCDSTPEPTTAVAPHTARGLYYTIL